MDRRSFLKTSAISLVAAKLGGESLHAANIATENVQATGFGPVTCENIEPGENDIKIRFLGTGAAGWKPGGNSPRRNSSVLVDDKFLIDFTISVEDMMPKDIHPTEIFYTHSHGDHYQPERALLLGIKKVYLSETWIERATADFKKAAEKTGKPMPEINGLKIGRSIQKYGITITPLPANHATDDIDEQTLIYLLEKGTTADKLGVRLLYATDTGGIMGRASKRAGFDTHKSATMPPRPITGFIMESTMGVGHEDDYRMFNHSNATQVGRIVNMLIKTQRYLPPTGQPAYITHMSPGLHDNLKQDALNKILPAPLRASYDGLVAVFKAVD